jgi:hypothetical protein
MERRQGGQAKRMSEHDDDTCPHLVRASLLEAENSRLKAEVERLTALVESNLNSSKVAMGKADAVLHERDSLKAEWKGRLGFVKSSIAPPPGVVGLSPTCPTQGSKSRSSKPRSSVSARQGMRFTKARLVIMESKS